MIDPEENCEVVIMEESVAHPKERLLRSLPVRKRGFAIRLWKRHDLDTLASWPDYPAPFDGFGFSFASMDPDAKDILFRKREYQEDRITLVMDHERKAAIGYVALLEIDWNKRTIGNMGVRLHPSWCDKGVGTLMTATVADWCLGNGIKKLRLDVAAPNSRAVRCYEKAGFIITGEFWRKDRRLRDVNISESQYDFLREHVLTGSGVPEIRFWWMELTGEVIVSPGKDAP
jgi:RimJ/RimL family protein N-acetyltransferase